tara:strand:- start:621 stop:728 length:108 start_codon:yes stop_codon:yes gene_type:complete
MINKILIVGLGHICGLLAPTVTQSKLNKKKKIASI